MPSILLIESGSLGNCCNAQTEAALPKPRLQRARTPIVRANPHLSALAFLAGMTMLRLTPRQRAALGETLRELANLAAAGLGLGQFVGSQPYSWWLMLVGVVMWLALVSAALVLEGDQRW